jgi:hypothetical protein
MIPFDIVIATLIPSFLPCFHLLPSDTNTELVR